MSPSLRSAGTSLKRFAEHVLAVLLGVMFVAFMIQIVARYVFNFPIGWTIEVTVITWLWLVLWGAAFVAKENEEIRIDLITSMVGQRTRIVLAIIVSIACVVLYAISLPGSYSYVTFMKVEKSAYLRIPMNWLFSIYVVFVVAIVARYLWLLSQLFRGKEPESLEPTGTGTAL